ncbi:MAG: hypothetical protein CMP67_04660 [Flavobacteriales bacterium]|nr:hypothetical protein [Flavobacteriales bacterium]
MKKLLFIVCLTNFGFTFNSNAQVDPQTSTEEPVDPNGPVITFDTLVVDFGTIDQGSDPFRIATFTNTGKKPLHITTCSGSCGCTVPKCPDTPIMPGEKGKMKVRYDTNRTGRISKTVTVKSNANNGTVTLRVVGMINAKQAKPAMEPNTGGPVMGQ